MNWLQPIGILVELLRGPFMTTLVHEDILNKTYRLSPDNIGASVVVYVESQRIAYRNHYQRWWVPPTVRCVYEVRGFADPLTRDRLAPTFFEPLTFPCLAGWTMRWTDRPHQHAIHAFMDQYLTRYQGTLIV
jgi:hypothetical protein